MYKNLSEYTYAVFKKPISMDKKKQVCPKCGKKTLQGYGDNFEKCKCFHPECGLHLNLNTINYGVDYSVALSEKLFEHAKSQLMGKDWQGHEWRSYLYLKERGISDPVIRFSDLGVILRDFDAEKESQEFIEELKKRIKEEKEQEKKAQLEEKLAEFTSLVEKLKKFTDNNHDRLAFFYRDKKGYITQIKTRKPYEKTFQILKIRKNAGVFNYLPFVNGEPKGKSKARPVGILEGEFNQLSWLTLQIEHAQLIPSCAVGGAQGADLETALSLTTGNVCIIYDNDDAGRSLFEQAKEIRSVYAVTVPPPHNDLDEYIKSFKDIKTAFLETDKLIKSAKKHYRELNGIKAQVVHIMKHGGSCNLEKCQKVTAIIIDELSERGKFMQDENFPYVFMSDEKKVIPLTDKNEQIKTVLNKMGVNAAKDYYRYVMEELRTHCHTYGEKIETHNFVHYDRKKNVLYLFNGDKTVYKITDTGIDELENGDEGVMFNYHADNEPFELVEFDKNKDYLKTYILDLMNVDVDAFSLEEDEQKELLRLWFYSTFFHSIMPSKVILTTVGEKGSGKTSTLRRLGLIFFGGKYNVTPLPGKEEDFNTLVANNHFVVLDNVDSAKPWLNDKLASIATGQTDQKRKLFTDNEVIKRTAKTFLCVTSRTPQFTRDDVADRLICLSFKRLDSFIPENELIGDIIENRNEIMSYIMNELQGIIKVLKETRERKYPSTFRIADFATFGLKLSDARGQKAEFEELLNKVSIVQKDFAVEEDSLVYALKILCKLNEMYGKEIEYSAFDLHKKLLDITCQERYDIPEFKARYKTVKSFARRIANIKSNIVNEVIIKVREIRSNKKLYTIELADKDFRLPLTLSEEINQAFDKALDKAEAMQKEEGDNG